MKNTPHSKLPIFLWIALAILTLALILIRIEIPEMLWATTFAVLLLTGNIVWLAIENRKALSSRTAAYGLNSLVTVLLVLGLLILINFLGVRYPYKIDMTQNKRHTLAEQTIKVLKELKQPVKVTFFGALKEKENYKALLENYQSTSPSHFQLEWSDPVRDVVRIKREGITHSSTVLLSLGERSSKVEAPTEEKLTNALIKLTKERKQTICTMTGHGEKIFNSPDEQGYLNVEKGLDGQGYTVRDFNIAQTSGVPNDCDAIAIVGPTKAFFPAELKYISDYLENGGRALIALDAVVEGKDVLGDFKKIIEDWGVHIRDELVLDQAGTRLTQDLAVILVPIFSKDHVITKDQRTECYFPVARPLEQTPRTIGGLTVSWLAKTLLSAWGETDIKGLKSGQLNIKPNAPKGPFVLGFAVEGKKTGSKAPRNTRLVVFGSSTFAANAIGLHGSNTDLFLNSASWVLEDESLISIRAKEEGQSKMILSRNALLIIIWTTVVFLPLGVVIAGLVIWLRRRKL